MRKSTFLTSIVCLVLLLTGIFFLRSLFQKEDPRKRYEQNLAGLNKQAPKPLKNDEKTLAGADQPDMAAFREYLLTMDPASGKVPRERLLDAYKSTIRVMREKSASTDTALLWQGCEADMGGRTRMIMYDPNDATRKKVWAGGVTGGLWYNNDIQSAASAWVPVGDFWPDLAIRCMTYDPNNPQIFYIGTGEAETAVQTYRESSGLGDGMWRSTDAGLTWNLISSTINFAYITKILVRNENGISVIYAGVASGLYQWQNHQSLPSDGLYRSTDGANTWQQVLPNITGLSVPYAVSDIAMGVNGRIFVGTRPNLNSNGAATLLYSDNGTSWTVNDSYKTEIQNSPTFNIPGRVVIAAAPSDSNIVYALIASGFINTANDFKYFYCFHILRSADKGLTWVKQNLPTDLTAGTNFATIAWHAFDVAVDPNNANNVYIGGLDVHKTTDGGNSWTRVSDWSLMYAGGGPQYIHADQHVIVYKPGSSTEILYGSDGGVFYTSNGTSSAPDFEEHNKNYTTLQFYSGAISPDQGAKLYLGGLQDNGCLLYSGSPLTINSMVSGGDGAYCFYDEYDPSFSISSLYYNVYYTFIYGMFNNYIGNWQSGIFVNPADYDYKLKNLYANATDYIGTYTNTMLRIDDMPGSGFGTFVTLNTNVSVYFSAVKYSPWSPNGKSTVYMGTQSGRLFRVNEAQSNSPVVTEITGTNFPLANISSIAIGGSEDTLLVTFSNYGVASVFQSYDNGVTWQNKETNLPDMPIRWAIYHPQNAKYALLATETGVWSTHNLDQVNTIWTPDVNGMANVRVDMLTIRKSDNTVLAATHGRGLFTTAWGIYTGIHEPLQPSFTVYPNPAHDKVSVSLNLSDRSKISIRIFDQQGKSMYTENSAGSGEAVKTIDFTGYASGCYLVDIRKNGVSLGIRKIVIY